MSTLYIHEHPDNGMDGDDECSVWSEDWPQPWFVGLRFECERYIAARNAGQAEHKDDHNNDQ